MSDTTVQELKQQLTALENRIIANNFLVGDVVGDLGRYMFSGGNDEARAKKIVENLQKYTDRIDGTFELCNKLRETVNKIHA